MHMRHAKDSCWAFVRKRQDAVHDGLFEFPVGRAGCRIRACHCCGSGACPLWPYVVHRRGARSLPGQHAPGLRTALLRRHRRTGKSLSGGRHRHPDVQDLVRGGQEAPPWQDCRCGRVQRVRAESGEPALDECERCPCREDLTDDVLVGCFAYLRGREFFACNGPTCHVVGVHFSTHGVLPHHPLSRGNRSFGAPCRRSFTVAVHVVVSTLL
mmetsp:Transcript_99031/g.229424  ORF Transcript_99031/g.229424 Transcript_99031/m.229424 type:complete len:212 (+) Transcript_99031:1210-1845(+)